MYSIETPLEKEYFNMFNCDISIDSCGYYELIYKKKLTIDDLLKSKRSGDIEGYDLSFLSKKEIDELMKKSIETGKDLLFEVCKDKKVVITRKMQREAWEKGQVLFL